MEVSASILSKEYKPKELVSKFNQTDVDYIHLDIMDGKFVKNKTWSISEIKKILTNNTKKLDVHLMVKNPYKFIMEYALLDVEYITFHYEATKNNKKINELIEKTKELGIKVGLSINPNTNVNEIEEFLPKLDLILVMSVYPGESGQAFMESVLYKIDILDKLRKEKNYNFKIEVDGGINNENVLNLKEKNVDIVVSASFIQDGNIKEKIASLR